MFSISRTPTEGDIGISRLDIIEDNLYDDREACVSFSLIIHGLAGRVACQ